MPDFFLSDKNLFRESFGNGESLCRTYLLFANFYTYVQNLRDREEDTENSTHPQQDKFRKDPFFGKGINRSQAVKIPIQMAT